MLNSAAVMTVRFLISRLPIFIGERSIE